MSSPSQQEQSKPASLLLWVFVASDDRIGELHHVYAHTEIEARKQAMGWMAEQVMLGRKDIEVKHWPGGFLAGYRTYWPGSIPIQPEPCETLHTATE